MLKETYRDGSKSAGLWVSGLLTVFHLSTSDNCIQIIMYHFGFVSFSNIHDSSERWNHIDVNTSKNDKGNYPSGPTLFWNDMMLIQVKIIINMNECRFDHLNQQ